MTYIFRVWDVVNLCKEPSSADNESEVPDGESAVLARLEMKHKI